MTTRIDEVLPALVALFTTALPTARVFDGPTPTGASLREWLLVGSDGESDDAATVDQEESTLGPGGWVDETGEITCSAWSFSGGTDVPARRTAALALVESCEVALNGDPTLGGLLAAGGRARQSPTRLQLMEQQTTAGAIARVIFTVTYSTTIPATITT